MQWRDRLIGALREMNAGGSAKKVHHICKANGGLGDVQEDILVTKVSPPFILC